MLWGLRIINPGCTRHGDLDFRNCLRLAVSKTDSQAELQPNQNAFLAGAMSPQKKLREGSVTK